VAGELKIIVPYTGNRIQKIAIPPDAITFSAAPPRGPMLNHFVGRVDDITHSNGSVRIRVLVGNDALFSEISESIFANMGIDKGMEVHGGIKINRLRYVGW
jgi:ABC-type molybdate transport system ATPase subunit